MSEAPEKATLDDLKNNLIPMSAEKFRAAGLLWFVNKILHVFGVTLIAMLDKDGNAVNLLPFETNYRGFAKDIDEKGFENMRAFMQSGATFNGKFGDNKDEKRDI